jgi:KaiC/GvpD/RAD55 family RecA-like ATPase
MVSKESKDRCPSGIPGFDKLCEGGFVRSSTNVVLGGPGSGKTLFLLQFLYNGATQYNETGAYISFEPDEKGLITDASLMGWDLKKLMDKGKCKILKLSPKMGFREIKDEILELASKNKMDRICIDPLNILSLHIDNEKDIREMIFDLTAALKNLNVTSLLADEVAGVADGDSGGLGDQDSRTTTIRFLADAVINLYSSGLGGASDRALRIEKMRRTNHTRGPVAFKITDKGLVVSK